MRSRSRAASATETPFGDSMSYTLHRASRELTRRLNDDVCRVSGITYSCLGVLMMIGSLPGADQREIADQLVLDNANCYNLGVPS